MNYLKRIVGAVWRDSWRKERRNILLNTLWHWESMVETRNGAGEAIEKRSMKIIEGSLEIKKEVDRAEYSWRRRIHRLGKRDIPEG